ncbi:MAG: ACT domain-containing protein [Clostridia bacterium]|nr:ACT domain-containing protein [Clostridia bacterium]
MIETSENITLVTLRNLPNQMYIIAKVFSAVAQAGVNVDMITQTQAHKNKVDLSFTVEDQDLVAAISALSIFKESGVVTDILSSCSKVVYLDEKMSQTPGYGARVFSALADQGIEPLIITTSVTDISVLVEHGDLETASQALKNMQ